MTKEIIKLKGHIAFCESPLYAVLEQEKRNAIVRYWLEMRSEKRNYLGQFKKDDYIEIEGRLSDIQIFLGDLVIIYIDVYKLRKIDQSI